VNLFRGVARFAGERRGARGVFFIAGAPAQAAARTEDEAERIVTSGVVGTGTAFLASPPPSSRSSERGAGGR